MIVKNSVFLVLISTRVEKSCKFETGAEARWLESRRQKVPGKQWPKGVAFNSNSVF